MAEFERTWDVHDLVAEYEAVDEVLDRIAAGPPTGADLLDDVAAFLYRFVVYPSEYAHVAHTLWVAHAHLMDAWESTPRIAFLSPEPGSGKSRALEVTELLVPRPLHAVNASPAALFRKVSDPTGAPTILFDEIDTVFGPRAKDNEDIRGMLNAGHRRGATALRCVIKGKEIETVEFPAYCAVALAGLDDLPDTIATRSVIIRMRRRAPGEYVEPFRHRLNAEEGHELADRLVTWATTVATTVAGAWPDMPPGIEDRNADVWEALLAVADAAGGRWPELARVTAVTLVTEKSQDERGGSLGVRLLADIRALFAGLGAEKLSTVDLLEHLIALDESPWGDLRGKPLDARGLSRRLARYDIKPSTQRLGDKVFKGYDRAILADAWSRYLPAEAIDNKASEIPPLGIGVVRESTPGVPNGAPANTSADNSVTAVTAVTPSSAHVEEPDHLRGAANMASAPDHAASAGKMVATDRVDVTEHDASDDIGGDSDLRQSRHVCAVAGCDRPPRRSCRTCADHMAAEVDFQRAAS